MPTSNMFFAPDNYLFITYYLMIPYANLILLVLVLLTVCVQKIFILPWCVLCNFHYKMSVNL